MCMFVPCVQCLCASHALSERGKAGACRRGSELWGTLAMRARRRSENMCYFGGTHGGVSTACLQEVIWGLYWAPADMCERNR